MHSGAFKPGEQTVDGNQIRNKDNGDYKDYDDPTSIMGYWTYGYLGLAANQLATLGVLKSVQEVTSSGDFTLQPLSTLGLQGGISAAFVRNSNLGFIW